MKSDSRSITDSAEGTIWQPERSQSPGPGRDESFDYNLVSPDLRIKRTSLFNRIFWIFAALVAVFEIDICFAIFRQKAPLTSIAASKEMPFLPLDLAYTMGFILAVLMLSALAVFVIVQAIRAEKGRGSRNVQPVPG